MRLARSMHAAQRRSWSSTRSLSSPSPSALISEQRSQSSWAAACRGIPRVEKQATGRRQTLIPCASTSQRRYIASSSEGRQASPATSGTSHGAADGQQQQGTTTASDPAAPHVSLLSSGALLSSGGTSDRVAIRWASGIESRFHHVWLRDHCRCPECYHPKTKQRLLNTFAVSCISGLPVEHC